MKKILAVFCIVSILTSCNKDKPITGDLTVSGYLTNGTSPVANATIDIDDLVQYRVTSNSEGFFEIMNVAEGTHQLNYKIGTDSDGFSQVSEKIEVNADLLLESLMLPDPVIMNEPEISRNFESNEVTLSWNRYTGDDFREYKLYKHSTSGLDETTGELLHVTTSAQDTTFTLTLPHNSETFFRVFVKDDFGLLGGSNILNYSIGPRENNPEVQVGVQKDFFLNSGEEQELYFEVPEAGFYLVAWFDVGFSPYTAYVSVSAQNNDKTSYYFQDEFLLIHDGAPMPIYVPSGERVYLNVKERSNDTSGTYAIKITQLPQEQSIPLEIGTELTQEIELGGVRVLHFEAEANKQYQIRVKNNTDTNSSPISAKYMSVYEEDANSFFPYNVHMNPCCDNIPELVNLSINSSKKVYLVVDNAYWLEETPADILVTEQ